MNLPCRRYRAGVPAIPGWLIALVLLMIPAAGGSLHAQETPYAGRHFLFPLPDTSRNLTGPLRNGLRTDARVVLFTTVPTIATLRGPGFERRVSLTPERSTILSLIDTSSRIFLDSTDVPSRRTYEIVADDPVTATVFYTTIFGSEAFTPLPVERWGRSYFAMLMPNQFLFHVGFIQQEEVTGAADGPAQIIVVAAENGTTVTIAPTGELRGGQARSVTLDAGEAYMVQTDSTKVFDPVLKINYIPPHELIGTRISADKPIGVISGNTRLEGAPDADSARTATGNTLRNSAVEWIAPVDLHGTTFVYRPVMPVDEEKINEVIRVVATSPGTTTVTLSAGGATRSMEQGGFIEYRTRDVRGSGPPMAFALTTDRPAEAMLITGNRAIRLNQITEEAETWAPAMTELVPPGRWSTFARFHSTLYPTFLRHYVAIAADSGARVWLDGREVSLDGAVTGAPYRHARVELPAGDHVLRSAGGTFTATAYSHVYGNEQFRPLKAEPKPDGGGSVLLHKSEYIEILAITYASPVASEPLPAPPADSLSMEIDEGCDSAIVTIRRIGADWRSGPLDVRPPHDSTNVTVAVSDTLREGTVVAYRIRLAPRDPARDALGAVIISEPGGRSWMVPYRYLARSVAVSPDPLILSGVAARRTIGTTATITNRQSFPVTIDSVTLANGTTGFLPGSPSPLPVTLAPGGSVTLPIVFRGELWGETYRDTILLHTSCRDQAAPIEATTGPAGDRPVPIISGYDWRQRLVGSTNDTLSFITNGGLTPYDVREVLLLDDAGGAFTLIPPDWRPIGRVSPGDTGRSGIRFVPPREGLFVGRIALVSTDDDTATAELRGIGVLPRVGVEDLPLGDLCDDAPIDTFLVIRNDGTAPLRVDALETILSSAPSVLKLDTAGLGLPRMLEPDSLLRIPLSILPNGVRGPVSYRILVHTDVTAGDSLADVTATFLLCARPKLIIDSLDLGTVWITLTRPGHLTLRNLGPGLARVDGITLVEDTAAAFAIMPRDVPFTIPEGDTVHIPTTFTPATIGLKTAAVAVAWEYGTLRGLLRGVGAKLIDTAFIRRDYHGSSGATVPIRIEMLHGLDTIAIDSLGITLGYDRRILDYHSPGDAGPARNIIVEREPDTLRIHLPIEGRPVGSGILAELRFLVRLAALDSSELPFRIETGLPYVEIIELPGLFRLDPICGLSTRLFEWTTHLFRLEQNQPNPASGQTRIEFEIPFDGRASLIVYDLLGTERLRLIDETLPAGAYVAELPAGALPSGAYEYRLVSGDWNASRRMIIR